jgi:hypothetical protein
MRLKNGQPEKETAQKNRQAQTQKAAETVASQKQVTLSFISGTVSGKCLHRPFPAWHCWRRTFAFLTRTIL